MSWLCSIGVPGNAKASWSFFELHQPGWRFFVSWCANIVFWGTQAPDYSRHQSKDFADFTYGRVRRTFEEPTQEVRDTIKQSLGILAADLKRTLPTAPVSSDDEDGGGEAEGQEGGADAPEPAPEVGSAPEHELGGTPSKSRSSPLETDMTPGSVASRLAQRLDQLDDEDNDEAGEDASVEETFLIGRQAEEEQAKFNRVRRHSTSVNRSRLLRVGSEQIIVVDSGSACIRVGVGGEEVPRVVQSMSGSREVSKPLRWPTAACFVENLCPRHAAVAVSVRCAWEIPGSCKRGRFPAAVSECRGSLQVGREFATQAAGARRRAPLSTSFESFAIDWDGMVRDDCQPSSPKAHNPRLIDASSPSPTATRHRLLVTIIPLLNQPLILPPASMRQMALRRSSFQQPTAADSTPPASRRRAGEPLVDVLRRFDGDQTARPHVRDDHAAGHVAELPQGADGGHVRDL